MLPDRGGSAEKPRFELPPAPEAHVCAVVEETLEVAVWKEPVEKSCAAMVTTAHVQRACRIALRRGAFDAVLLPMDEERVCNTVAGQPGGDRVDSGLGRP